MNCHTPCCGRFAPSRDMVGHIESATTPSRAAANAAGSVSPPVARTADSAARASAAAQAHAAAGTAVEPRTRKAPRQAAAAATIAATQQTSGRSTATGIPLSLPCSGLGWGRDEWEACGGRGARRSHRGPIPLKALGIPGSIAPRRRASRKHPTHAPYEVRHRGSYRRARRLGRRTASDRDVHLLRRRQPHRPAESGSADRGLSWHPAAERSDPRPPKGDTPAAGAVGRRRARHAGRWRHHPFHANAHDAAAGRHRNGSHTTAGAGPAGGELIRHPADPHDAELPPRAAAYFFSAGGSPASFLSFDSRSTASDRVANIGSLASTSSRILRARSFSPRSVRILAT